MLIFDFCRIDVVKVGNYRMEVKYSDSDAADLDPPVDVKTIANFHIDVMVRGTLF